MRTIKNASVKVLIGLLLICGLCSLTSCGQREEQAQVVWLYDYQGMQRVPFWNVTVYEKRTGYIKFRTGVKVIEHSGRYTVENSAK